MIGEGSLPGRAVHAVSVQQVIEAPGPPTVTRRIVVRQPVYWQVKVPLELWMLTEA